MTDPSNAVAEVLSAMTTRALAEAAKSPLDKALDAFAQGLGTLADVETIARESSLEFIQIHVHRRTPPRSTKSIALPIHSPDGPGRRGPKSAPWRAVTQVSENRYNGVWAAWWRVADLRAWVAQEKGSDATEHPEPTVAELAALLAAVEPFIVRAAVGAKPHAQDKDDAAAVLPKLRDALARCPRPRAVMSADGSRVDYLPAEGER